jgi:hypothetical protein
LTYVAPATKISIVLAFVNPDNVATKRILAIITTIIRGVTLFRELQIITGANRKVMMMDAISVRVVRAIKEPEKMYTFESLETSL